MNKSKSGPRGPIYVIWVTGFTLRWWFILSGFQAIAQELTGGRQEFLTFLAFILCGATYMLGAFMEFTGEHLAKDKP